MLTYSPLLVSLISSSISSIDMSAMPFAAADARILSMAPMRVAAPAQSGVGVGP